MSEYVHLIGSEQVQSAACIMREAAESMRRAAESIDFSIERLIRALDAHAQTVANPMEHQL